MNHVYYDFIMTHLSNMFYVYHINDQFPQLMQDIGLHFYNSMILISLTYISVLFNWNASFLFLDIPELLLILSGSPTSPVSLSIQVSPCTRHSHNTISTVNPRDILPLGSTTGWQVNLRGHVKCATQDGSVLTDQVFKTHRCASSNLSHHCFR